ncbi:MAG TPA: sugar phosphate nucleotidyltransferase [Candidatus Dormibacteraeota bacterium]|nr:sugar phosphate nucleotidyltransferase [Candidatus Dormibacteraeota bacterium]
MSKEAAGLRAVILAGGKGTRLAPYTANFPKPLMPLGDMPVVEVLIRRLAAYGITDITLTLGHLAELVKAYFGHRRGLEDLVNLRFVEEDEPTGTAGSLALIDGLDQTFLTMNGDILTDLDFDDLIRFHREKGADLTIATHERRVKLDLGVIELDGDRRVRGYREKPESVHHVSMGIYVYEPRVLERIEKGVYLDFPSLVLKLLAEGRPVWSFVTDCLWLDIGRPDDYATAQQMFAESRETFMSV